MKEERRSFVDSIYIPRYRDKMGRRGHGFQVILEKLEEINRDFYTIVETGTLRKEGNFGGDGQSTLIWDEFVNFYDGMVVSFDIDERACTVSDRVTSDKTFVINEDSIKGLSCNIIGKFGNIDLLYLDSYDVDFSNPLPSSLHHLRELEVVWNSWNSHDKTYGTIIAVDDNKRGKGKGQLVSEFLEERGYFKFLDDYQIAYYIGDEK